MKKRKEIWPSWSIPSDDEQLALARVLMPYVKILSPDIIRLLVDENNNKLEEWTQAFHEVGIRADVYLWQNSPVAFPGIRRYVGRDEQHTFKKSSALAYTADCLSYEDNSYPKEIWSHSLRNSETDKTNPAGYSLAHVIDHKDYKSKNADELTGFIPSEEKNLFAGLFTSAANTLYIPASLLKPTDQPGNLRRLIIQFIDAYYGPVCTLLPHNLSCNLTNISDEWKLSNFPKPTEVGKLEYARNFIRERNKIIDEKIKKRRRQLSSKQ